MKIIKNTQYGRSMVEMLGVLAIIGVLSVGAVAGYSKAMFKHKMNKTMDVLNFAMSRLAELSSANMGNVTISNAKSMKDYGLIPDCDVTYRNPSDEYGGERCPISIGEIDASINFSESSKPTGYFKIRILNNPYEYCVALLNAKFYESLPESFWYNNAIAIAGKLRSEKEFYSKTGYNDTATEVTLEDILYACESCKSADGGRPCHVGWTF